MHDVCTTSMSALMVVGLLDCLSDSRPSQAACVCRHRSRTLSERVRRSQEAPSPSSVVRSEGVTSSTAPLQSGFQLWGLQNCNFRCCNVTHCTISFPSCRWRHRLAWVLVGPAFSLVLASRSRQTHFMNPAHFSGCRKSCQFCLCFHR